MLKLSTFTDESGQDTLGRVFVVCTVCLDSKNSEVVEGELKQIEKKSGKSRKWYNTGDKKRHLYVKLLLESHIIRQMAIYYSKYENKKEYISLIGAHITKSVLAYTKDKPYVSKIFIDKMDKQTISKIKKEIKSFHIRYKKITGLSDESSALVRLSDSLCGAIRDLGNKGVANSYKKLFARLIEI